MKKAYCTPKAQKVNYTFQEQMTAESYPINNYADPWHGGVCTWGDGSCSAIFYTKTRSLTDCVVPGDPSKLNPYGNCY